jgi:hypothetical protein
MTNTPVKPKSTRRRVTSIPDQLTPAMLQSSIVPRPETPGPYRMVLNWIERRRAKGVVPRPETSGLYRTILNWIERRRAGGVVPCLRVTETISLGEKRFVSVVHVDGQRFLIGGSASNVALLMQLDTPVAAFATVLRTSARTRKRSPAPAIQVPS